MTKYLHGDEVRTAELVRQLNTDTTWLRHRGQAAELDRRLLLGATDAELAEVRVSWREHITHLRSEHRLQLVESPAGFWRFAASTVQTQVQVVIPQPEEPVDQLASEADYEDGDIVELDASPQVQDRKYLRLHETARALSALAGVGLLGNDLIKASAGMLIRQASESNHWHNCAHFRSKRAAALIQAQKQLQPNKAFTAAQYQAFCRSNLRHEHVVPNSVIYEMLKELEDHSVAAISDLLKTFCIRATVTLEEDEMLRRGGFSSCMPTGFTDPGDKNLFRKPLARYIAVGLADQLEPLPLGLLWHQVP